MVKFKVPLRTCEHDGECFILLLNLNATPTNLIHGKIAISEEVEPVEINAKYYTNEIKLYFQVSFPLAFLNIINRYFQNGTMIAIVAIAR